ncbi:MAG TPA: NAD(P)/FAD-dependent oxidoreductase, partial [Dehalococcoidia bacterium]
SLWPKDGVDLRGKRVGMIGTGSSAVQATPEIAAEAAHLFVFQRTPTYTFPTPNRPLESEFQRKAKDNYEEIRRVQRQSQAGISGYTPAGAFMQPPTLKIMETTAEERMKMVDERGWMASRLFSDAQSNLEANELAVEMYREMIRRTVDDPEVAETLSPRGYPLGCKRVVIDKDYFVTFNRDNVTLVDLQKEPIEAITPNGLKTAAGEYEFDVLIYATGFDAMTGALNRIDIRGRKGETLRRKWEHGPKAYLGIQVAGFPNMFTITGPGSPSVLSNMIVSIEQHVDWIADALEHMIERNLDTIEPTEEAQEAWVEHVNQVSVGTMYTAETCNSWYLGANIAGKTRVFMPYVGGVGKYAERCREIVGNGYEGFVLERAEAE